MLEIVFAFFQTFNCIIYVQGLILGILEVRREYSLGPVHHVHVLGEPTENPHEQRQNMQNLDSELRIDLETLERLLT